MNPNHPKAIEAQQKAEQFANVRQSFRETVKAATARGLHFLVIGDHTICYKVDQHDVMQFSTAIRNRKMDKPISEIGKAIALQRFESGAVAIVRKPRHFTPRDWFSWSFQS